MAKQTLAAMVEGGKASAAPPLGPALGPSGLNIGEVIAKINERTKEFSGMQVPIKVTFEKGSKGFEIEVGTPPASALIKKELGIKEPVKEEKAADLAEAIIGTAEIEAEDFLEEKIKEVVTDKVSTEEDTDKLRIICFVDTCANFVVSFSLSVIAG